MKPRDLLAVAILAGGLALAQQPNPAVPGIPGPAAAQAPAAAPAQPQQTQNPAAQPGPNQTQPAQAPPAQTPTGQPLGTQPAAQVPAQPASPAPPSSVRIGNLSLQNASLTEVIDQLARQLQMNYILDPAVKGSIVLNTYGEHGQYGCPQSAGIDSARERCGHGAGGRDLAHRSLEETRPSCRCRPQVNAQKYSRRRPAHAEPGLPQIRDGGGTHQGAGRIFGRKLQHVFVCAGESPVHSR